MARSSLAIYLVFSNIELDEVWSFVRKSNPYSLGFAKFKSTTLQAIFWSLSVQLAQLVCAWFILSAYGVNDHFAVYFVLILVSSIAAMLPICFGGGGLRELDFLYASQKLPIDETAAVALVLVFFFNNCFEFFL